MSLAPFLISARARIHEGPHAQRCVQLSRLRRASASHRLENLVADRAPLFYRSPDQITGTLREGYFLTAFAEALRRLPTSTHFHDSHFGEILSAMFATDILGWHLIYSKLKLLTTPNSNPHKMDLLLFALNEELPTLILGEVKSSMKSHAPANHHRSCYASLFDSLRDYSDADLAYDLTAARDNIDSLPPSQRDAVRMALLPYANPNILYAGFTVVDTHTNRDNETSMLATRSSPKTFDIELVCVDDLSAVSTSTYTLLDNLRSCTTPIL